MVNPVALCTVLLSFLALTGGAADVGDPINLSANVDLNLTLGSKNGKVAAAWWASWNADYLPLDKISWGKYTHMTYAFA